jgi:hypothetical protein
MVKMVVTQVLQGNRSILVTQVKDGYRIQIYRINSNTHKKYTHTVTIPRENVKFIRGLFSRLKSGESISYENIVRKIVKHYKISIKEMLPAPVVVSLFNGGVFRRKYYFPMYYYPIKILEADGFLKFKRNKIIKV